ncbi:TadA family conjugal transfer-associated ATPase [Streptomyces sp. NPDC048337]|uniref:TadA family conjugal transfer-associated ATPase n=1 Tax=Streptomyces sp. NPDC048337 TaxID=3365535 RepID=UPI00371C4537
MSAVLLDAVRRRLAETGAEPTPARVAAALRAQGRLLGDAEVLGVAAELRSELVGAGPLEPLLADPEVTDVLVAAPDRVWVDRGGGLELTGVTFADADAVRRLAQRLAAVAGRRLDDARPWVDARMPDGTRLHAVLPPVAVGSACLSLRVVRPRAFTLEELVAAGTLPPGGHRLLREMVEARLSFLVSGGTGTGKTTLLSALLGLVGPGERIVLAEDSAELRPDHPHVVRLETRPANQEGAGLVTLADLVRQALRMRPDRLVVGEVRGPEVADLLAALNTGHEGECLPKPYIELGSAHGETPPMRHGGQRTDGATAAPSPLPEGKWHPAYEGGPGREPEHVSSDGTRPVPALGLSDRECRCPVGRVLGVTQPAGSVLPPLPPRVAAITGRVGILGVRSPRSARQGPRPRTAGRTSDAPYGPCAPYRRPLRRTGPPRAL